MNIFFLSMNPKIAAMWHCDKHVVKMIIEAAQLLCCIHWLAREASDPSLVAKKTASPKKQKPAVASPPSTPTLTTPTINTNDEVVQSSEAKDKIPYKKSHAHHPMVGWIQASLANYNWCLDLGLHLSDEYTHRYNKIHKTKACLEWLSEHKPELPNVGFTNPPLCMPEPYKNTDDFVGSYRQYYIHDKRRFARWTKRDVPEWFTEGVAKLEEQEKQEQKDNPESAEEVAAAAPKAKKSPKKKSPAKPKVKAESSTTPQPPTRERLSRKAKTDAQQKMDQSQDAESDDGDTIQYRKRKSTTSPNNKNRKKAKM